MIDFQDIPRNRWAKIGAIFFATVLLGLGVVVVWFQFIPLSELSLRASEYRLHGQRWRAVELYKMISVRASRYDYSSNYELGNLYTEARDYAKARYHYLKAARNPAATPSVFFQLSELYLKRFPKRSAEFVKFMEERIASDKMTDPNVYLVLASFYQQNNQIDQAVSLLNRGLSAIPHDPALTNLLNQLSPTS